jgi:hypothetical protein
MGTVMASAPKQSASSTVNMKLKTTIRYHIKSSKCMRMKTLTVFKKKKTTFL